jgi:hypothetical protein
MFFQYEGALSFRFFTPFVTAKDDALMLIIQTKLLKKGVEKFIQKNFLYR